MKLKLLYGYLITGAIFLQLAACKKDKTAMETAPLIELDHADEYKVKTGYDIILSANVSNANEPIYTWKLAGKIISTGLTCKFSGDKVGEYFVTFRVDAKNGSTERQVKVTVLDKLPPQITTETAMIIWAGEETKLSGTALYAEKATYIWRLNGTVVGTDSTYLFKQMALGTAQLSLKVTTEDGFDLKNINLTVLPKPQPELFFDDGRFHLTGSQTIARMSVPLGKSLVIAPVICNISGTQIFEWTVDGVVQSSTSEYLTFTPTAKKTYLITVTAKGTLPLASAQVNVECVSPEGTYFRAPVASSKPFAGKVFDYVPAPGQFIDFQIGSTYAAVLAKMQSSGDVDAGAYLGAYGGYFISGFDHSVTNVLGQADLSISGNAFAGWSEPGIVWVMQDENGNGLPDDTWYELKGSETGKPETLQRYAITYFKPSAAKSDVLWIDNRGGTGSVNYNGFHSQAYYFPMFITSSSYTLSGTRLKSTFEVGTIETSKGYAWGYVDNYGDGSKLNFWIEDAIKADGSPANLKYIDFVRVHTAMAAKGAALGEISTESGSPKDINLK